MNELHGITRTRSGSPPYRRKSRRRTVMAANARQPCVLATWEQDIRASWRGVFARDVDQQQALQSSRIVLHRQNAERNARS
jgi:hypothetical protein